MNSDQRSRAALVKANRVRKKVLERRYTFDSCRDDLDLARSVSDGTTPNMKQGDPNFHAYAATLNVAGTFATQALDLLELTAFNNKLADLQESYMPGYPPLSPVTTSLFQAWMILDGTDSATSLSIGQLFADYAATDNSMADLREALDVLNASYCSFYEVTHVGENWIKMWDIPGRKEIFGWNSSGYSGQVGEVWYVRVLPPILSQSDCWVTLNTPYVFRKGGRRPWEEFFERVMKLADGSNSVPQNYLKYGKFLGYWLEFVFQAYCSHNDNAIFVAGFPDKPDSLPHSEHGQKL